MAVEVEDAFFVDLFFAFLEALAETFSIVDVGLDALTVAPVVIKPAAPGDFDGWFSVVGNIFFEMSSKTFFYSAAVAVPSGASTCLVGSRVAFSSYCNSSSTMTSSTMPWVGTGVSTCSFIFSSTMLCPAVVSSTWLS